MDKIDQKLTDLYENWQAEYKNSVMSMECEEIRRFYRPYLEKYKSKYRILYQMLQQANRQMRQINLPSMQEHVSEMTPSLATLDDAPTFRNREWKRSKPCEEMPQQYSTVSGHLTPTPQKHKDM